MNGEPAQAVGEGRTLGEFILRDKIGEGGFAAVYRAQQPTLEREAVVKVLHARLAGRDDVIQRFLRESRLAARLDHPYAAHVYAFGAEPDGTLWIAMELVRGTPMDKLLEEQGPIAIERFVPLFDRICEVVQTAHERGIVHRDLKPANVMVLSRAGRLLPKLLDFGIARVSEETAVHDTRNASSTDVRRTRVGAFMGTPMYMAPEQWSDAGSVGPATDIYALGVLAYEALTGRAPFRGATVDELLVAHARASPPPVGGDLPVELDAVFARALAKRPADRYASAGDLAAAVRLAAGQGESDTLPALDDALREAMAAGAPQPLAEAVAALETARNVDQACAIVWDVVAITTRWIGILALAARTKIGSGSDGDSRDVREQFRALARGSFSDDEWLSLARALGRPFTSKRDVYPVPELVGLLHETTAFSDAFGKLRTLRGMLDRRAGKTDEQRRTLYAEALVVLSELLRPLRFLIDYTPIAVRQRRAERWRGLRRQPRPVVVRRARPLPEGEVHLLGADNHPVLRLSPLVQVAAPAPGKDDELFLFDSRDAHGARLVAVPLGFERHDPELDAWLRDQLFGSVDSELEVSDEVTPYRGLSAFTASDASFFFGREREIDAFLNRLRVEAFLAVVGPSGAGKSSFVQAGILPRLPTSWRAIVARPGPSPFAMLEARLERERIDAGAQLGERLRATAAREGSTIVLVIDQLEELFTLCRDEAERTKYCEALADASRSADDSVRVIVTLRDDFLIRAQSEALLRERIGRGIKLLATPDPEDLQRIVVEPAKRVGYQLEDRALVDDMVAEVAGQPGALALLSFTAAELWKLRDRHFHQLSRKAYASIGGVGGALARHAEATLGELTTDEQRLVREAFRHLVTAEGTRQVLALRELRELLKPSGRGREEVVLDRLVSARLLVISEDAGGEDRVEVIHEALLTAWPRLVQWRREDSEGARLRDQLRVAAKQWESRGRPRGLLWRDEALTEYQIWRARFPGAVTELEDAFGRASVADAARGRRIRRALSIGAFAILSVGLLIMFQLRQRAEQQSDLADARARDIRAQLVKSYEERAEQALFAGDTRSALQHLDDAFQLGADSEPLRFMIARALEPMKAERFTFDHANQVWNVELDRDASRILTMSQDGHGKLWSATSGQWIADLAPHAEGILVGAWSVDGREIVTADAAGVVRVWSRDGTLLTTFEGQGGAVQGLALDRTGTFVAASSRSGLIRIWNLRERTLHASWDADPRGVNDLRFDPMSDRLVIAGNSTVAIWDLAGNRQLELGGHRNFIWYARFDPTGRFVATASIDKTGRLFDARSGGLLLVMEHDDRVTHVAFDAAGDTVATTSADRTAKLWNTAERRLHATLRGHTAQLNRVVFRPGHDQVLTVAGDGAVRVWDTKTGIQSASYWHGGFVFDIDVVADGSRAATTSWSGTAKLWDLDIQSRDTIAGPPDLSDASISSDGRRVLLRSPKELVVWSPPTAERRVIHVGAASAALSDDGRVLVSIADGMLRVIDAQTGLVTRTIERAGTVANNEGRGCLAVDARGEHAASCTGDAIVLWDLIRGRELRRAHATVSFVQFDVRRQRIIATGEADHAVRVFSMASLDEVVLHGHTDRVHQIAISPVDDTIVTTSYDGTARVWANGREVHQLPHRGRVFAVAWSPKHDLLITGLGDGMVSFWDTRAWRRVAHVRGHNNYVTSAAFSADGELLVTGAGDGSVVVWNANRYSKLTALAAGGLTLLVGFDEREEWLVTVSTDSVARWRADRYRGGRDELSRITQKLRVAD